MSMRSIQINVSPDEAKTLEEILEYIVISDDAGETRNALCRRLRKQLKENLRPPQGLPQYEVGLAERTLYVYRVNARSIAEAKTRAWQAWQEDQEPFDQFLPSFKIENVKKL